jgi:hypothetical protein
MLVIVCSVLVAFDVMGVVLRAVIILRFVVTLRLAWAARAVSTVISEIKLPSIDVLSSSGGIKKNYKTRLEASLQPSNVTPTNKFQAILRG